LRAAEAQRAQLQQRLEDKTQKLNIYHIELTEAQEELQVLRCKGKELFTFQGKMLETGNGCLQSSWLLLCECSHGSRTHDPHGIHQFIHCLMTWQPQADDAIMPAGNRERSSRPSVYGGLEFPPVRVSVGK